MNHLAHAFLAAPDPASIVGNLAADWAKGALDERYAQELRGAMAMHRRIDAFVDDHAATHAACARVGLGRYGPVVVDVVNDYLLATDWRRVSQVELEAFAGGVYGALDQYREMLPDGFRERAPRMVASRWLEGFHDLENIDRILRHVGSRLRRPGPLVHGIEPVLPNLEGLRQEFHVLLPDAVRFARSIDPCAAPWSRVG